MIYKNSEIIIGIILGFLTIGVSVKYSILKSSLYIERNASNIIIILLNVFTDNLKLINHYSLVILM